MVKMNGTSVEFRFYHPVAQRVCVVGDFNHWRPDELMMQRNVQGYWTARLDLPPGDYRFRYLADGQWFTDYAAFGVKEGPFGVDSVLWVARPRAETFTHPAPLAAATGR